MGRIVRELLVARPLATPQPVRLSPQESRSGAAAITSYIPLARRRYTASPRMFNKLSFAEGSQKVLGWFLFFDFVDVWSLATRVLRRSVRAFFRRRLRLFRI